jgi:Tfp pilus assembly protein PilX
VPHWFVIVLIVLAVLAVAGFLARRAQLRRSRPAFERSLDQVNRDLAEAAAQDRGWDRATLEDAARRIYASERGADPTDLLLIEVRDRPGTDEDQAVFRCGNERLTLGRRDGEWVHESLT